MILLNGQRVEFSAYPNGETLLDPEQFRGHGFELQPPYITVTLKYETDQDLLHLMFVKRHLDSLLSGTAVDLQVRYMPYSRMDRAGSGVFTLRYVTDFINALQFRRVTVFEPHSDVTCALLNNSVARYPTMELLPRVRDMIDFQADHDFLFFPDAGAQKRYAGLTGYQTAVGFKHRDFATGKLNGHMTVAFDGFEMPDRPEEHPDGRRQKMLIMDDLCSRGGTFIMSAQKLREMFDCEVYLLVAHCENTMWEGELLDHIDGLYCTDSILGDAPDMAHRRTKVQIPTKKVHIYSEGKWL